MELIQEEFYSFNRKIAKIDSFTRDNQQQQQSIIGAQLSGYNH